MADTKPALRDLIERLERAEGPSRELDAEIRKHVPGDYLPAFTTSLDAALTLVPPPVLKSDKGRKIEISYSEWIPQASATVNYQYIGFARTPAIATVIAALKAREAGNG